MEREGPVEPPEAEEVRFQLFWKLPIFQWRVSGSKQLGGRRRTWGKGMLATLQSGLTEPCLTPDTLQVILILDLQVNGDASRLSSISKLQRTQVCRRSFTCWHRSAQEKPPANRPQERFAAVFGTSVDWPMDLYVIWVLGNLPSSIRSRGGLRTPKLHHKQDFMLSKSGLDFLKFKSSLSYEVASKAGVPMQPPSQPPHGT